MILYSLLIIELILLLISVKLENIIGSFVSLILSIIIYHYFVDKLLLSSVGNYVQSNYLEVILFSMLYLALGAVWSFFKWYQFLKNKVNEKFYGGKPMHTKDGIFLRFKEGQYSKMISNWILFFPISLLLYIFGDLVTIVGEEIQKALSKIYIILINKMFK